jgi:hypothetical protein
MSRKIFVSHEFLYNDKIGALKGWFQPNGPCDGEPVFIYDPKATTKEAIDTLIKDAINDSKAVLFVATENVHNKPWIDREAELANSRPVPIVIMPLKDNPLVIPNRLKGRDDVHIVPTWGSTALCAVLNRL